MKSEPKLSPKLIAKLQSFDLDVIADLLKKSSLPRVGMSKLDDFPTREVEGFSDRWSPDSVDDEGLWVITVRSPKVEGSIHQFLASEDWSQVAIPLDMLPPEYLGDPLLKRWHWWQGEGSEAIVSEETARYFAKSFTHQFHGATPNSFLPTTHRIIQFDVRSAKAAHTFITRDGWKGVWCPNYMAPEGSSHDPRHVRWTPMLKETEIGGEKAVRKYATAMAKAFDREKKKPVRPKSPQAPRVTHYHKPEQIEKLHMANRWLNLINPNPVSSSKALAWLIDEGFKSVPPESEWESKKLYPWEQDKGETT